MSTPQNRKNFHLVKLVVNDIELLITTLAINNFTDHSLFEISAMRSTEFPATGFTGFYLANNLTPAPIKVTRHIIL